jgi:hypothetical protein
VIDKLRNITKLGKHILRRILLPLYQFCEDLREPVWRYPEAQRDYTALIFLHILRASRTLAPDGVVDVDDLFRNHVPVYSRHEGRIMYRALIVEFFDELKELLWRAIKVGDLDPQLIRDGH